MPQCYKEPIWNTLSEAKLSLAVRRMKRGSTSKDKNFIDQMTKKNYTISFGRKGQMLALKVIRKNLAF